MMYLVFFLACAAVSVGQDVQESEDLSSFRDNLKEIASSEEKANLLYEYINHPSFENSFLEATSQIASTESPEHLVVSESVEYSEDASESPSETTEYYQEDPSETDPEVSDDGFERRVLEVLDQPCEDETLRVGSVRGIPGVHFPYYDEIPLTSFTCAEKHIPGFYADLETGCQVFHVCWPHRRESFLCPVGTTFNQAILACDYWYSSNCSLAPTYYDVNDFEQDSQNGNVKPMVDSLIEVGQMEVQIPDVSSDHQDVQADVGHILKFLPTKSKVLVCSPESEPVESEPIETSEPVFEKVHEVVKPQVTVVETSKVVPVEVYEPVVQVSKPVAAHKWVVKPVSKKQSKDHKVVIPGIASLVREIISGAGGIVSEVQHIIPEHVAKSKVAKPDSKIKVTVPRVPVPVPQKQKIKVVKVVERPIVKLDPKFIVRPVTPNKVHREKVRVVMPRPVVLKKPLLHLKGGIDYLSALDSVGIYQKGVMPLTRQALALNHARLIKAKKY